MNLAQIKFDPQRLVIRSCTPSDASALSALMTTQISQQMANWPYSLSHQQALAQITTSLKVATVGLGIPAVVREKQTLQVIGWHLLQQG